MCSCRHIHTSETVCERVSMIVSASEQVALTGGVVVDPVELLRTRSGDQLTCCTPRPTGSYPIHRQVTVHTCKERVIGERQKDL